MTYTARARTLGIIAAWVTFIMSEVHAVVSGIAFVSRGAAVESGSFFSIMALLVVVMGPFLVLSMIAIHAYACSDDKPYSIAALAFMIACVTVISCINFMLLAAPVFRGNPLRNALRWVMILSGALCIAGLIWLAVSPAQAIIIGILGWGAAGPIVFLLLANLFVRVQAQTMGTPAP